MAIDEQTQAELAALALQLSSNPKTRKSFLKLTKEVNPNTPIPEVDVESEIDSKVKAVSDDFGKKLAAIEEERSKEKFASERARVQSKHNFSDDEMKKMEELMTKGELPMDYKFAPTMFKQQIEPVGSTNYGADYGPVEMPSAEGLMDNEVRWSNKTAHQIVDELRAKSQKTF